MHNPSQMVVCGTPRHQGAPKPKVTVIYSISVSADKVTPSLARVYFLPPGPDQRGLVPKGCGPPPPPRPPQSARTHGTRGPVPRLPRRLHFLFLAYLDRSSSQKRRACVGWADLPLLGQASIFRQMNRLALDIQPVSSPSDTVRAPGLSPRQRPLTEDSRPGVQPPSPLLPRAPYRTKWNRFQGSVS